MTESINFPSGAKIEFCVCPEGTKTENMQWKPLGTVVTHEWRHRRKMVKARILKKAAKKLAENKYYLFGE